MELNIGLGKQIKILAGAGEMPSEDILITDDSPDNAC